MESNKKYSLNAAAYDKIADEWQDFRKTCVVNKCVEEFCAILPDGARVLDAGCGTGYPISAYLVARGYNVTGIDPSEKMLEKAKALRLKNARFFKSDFLGFETGEKFDAIIAFDCLWYIEPDRQREIYSKAASLLKDGGYFMFTHGKENGEIDGLIVQNPFGMGYAAVVAAARTVLEAGNEAVVNTGYVWVDSENMEDEAVQPFLYN